MFGNCTHPSNGRCLNCMSKIQENEKVKPKCYHSNNTFCINCLPEPNINYELQDTRDSEIPIYGCICDRNKDNKIVCNACLDRDKLKIDLQPFDKMLEEKRKSCPNKSHSSEKACNICAYHFPNYFPKNFGHSSYIQKLDSNKDNSDITTQLWQHLPYPKGRCINCIAPTCNIKPQKFRRIDYIVFKDTKKIKQLISQWQANLTSTFKVFLYGKIVDEPEATKNKFAKRAEIYSISHYLPSSGQKRILNALGLKLLGIAKSVLPKSQLSKGTEKDIFMTSDEVIENAKFITCDYITGEMGLNNRVKEDSSLFGNSKFDEMKVNKGIDEFFTLYFKFDKNNNIDSSAYSVSDQFVALFKTGIISNSVYSRSGITLKEPSKNMENLFGTEEEKKFLTANKSLPVVIHKGKEIKYVDENYYRGISDGDCNKDRSVNINETEKDELRETYEIYTDFFIVKSVTTMASNEDPLFKKSDFERNMGLEYLKNYLHNNLYDENLLSDFDLLLEIGEFIGKNMMQEIIDRVNLRIPIGEDINTSIITLFY